MSRATDHLLSAAESDPTLAQRCDEIIERLKAGDGVDLAALAVEHPEHADQIRRLLPALEVLVDLGVSSARDPARVVSNPDAADLTPKVLGDFQILREVGRGGMGVVYEAEQLSLGRRVALKVLPMAAAIDPRQLQRFRLEAQAAGCLHHTHIVPVHAVGIERGVPYYAMQFIEGRSLAQLIAELRRLEGLDAADGTAPALADLTTSALAASLLAGGPARPEVRPNPEAPTVEFRSARPGPDLPSYTSSPGPAAPKPQDGRASSSGSSTRDRAYIRNVARLGLEAAEALDHAHVRGILHRDIKPGNLLVDAEGRLWVTDFGLAQIQGDHRMTLTGDILGTLRYMSPEQALGKRVVVDGRTDLYSLGATLYELLTLRPALDGRGRAEVLRQIATEEPTPLRKLNPAVPADLVTVVHKALAREPSERYATARDLAEDLNRFLLDRPILAKPPSLLDRAVKWSRRHKTVVAAVASVLVLSVVGLSTGMVLVSRERAEAVRQRDEARRQREFARRAVDDMYTQVAEKWLRDQPGLTTLQREFLEKALASYEQLATGAGADPQAQYEALLASYRVGTILRQLGKHTTAETALRRVVARGTDLVGRFPDHPEFRLGLAEARIALAAVDRELGKSSGADVGLTRELPDGRKVETFYGGTRREHRATEADQQIRLAGRDLAGLRTAFLSQAEPSRRLAEAHEAQSKELTAARQVSEAEAAAKSALDIWDQLVRDNPGELEYRTGLASAHLTHGIQLMWWGGQDEDALAAFRQAETSLAELMEERPKDPRIRYKLAVTLNNTAVVLGRKMQNPGAGAAWRRAGALYEGLAADFPEVPEYKDAFATSLNGQAVTIGGLLVESLNPGLEKPPANATIQGRLREIEEIRKRAVGIRQHLAERHPDVPEYEEQYLGSMLDLSRIRHLRENQEGARVLLEQALTRAEAFLKTHPDSLRGLMHARSALDYLAIMAIESGDHAAATRYAEGWARGQLEFYRRASHLKEWTDGDLASVASDECENQLNRPDSLPREGPLASERMLAASVEASRLEFKALVQEATQHATDFPRTLYHLADALTTAPAEYRDPELALRLARRAVELKPEDGMCRQSLGWALYRAGDLEGCITTLSEEDFMHCPFLAMAHWRLGDKDRAFELFDRADKGLPGYERRCEERLKQGGRSYPSPAVLRRVQAEATALLGVESSKGEARPRAAPDSAGPPA